MDKPKVTPKDFFLWAGAMIAVYASFFAFISLLFDYLNYAFPDPLQYFPADPYSGGISYEMASLIVLVPLATWLLLIIQGTIRRDSTRSEIWVRKWALYLTLFIAGITVAADLITLIMYFLQGDVTVRFLLKVVVVLLVVGAGFFHFLADLHGYWAANPTKSKLVAWSIGALVVISIGSGFFIVGTPWEARLYRFDEQKVSDLQQVQWQLVNFWQSKEKLPVALSELQDPISGFIVPSDPQTGAAYTYEKTGALSFKLCAAFNAETKAYGPSTRTVPVVPAGGTEKAISDNWQHGAGEVCFERTIDPQLYPPLSKQNTR
ncbi:hypothetical protein HY418_00835 [Candidatus Kaiserbacteria bacterium]|nr:hypothetical protein [Candidatus Kaiserbacteria bacterium]